MNICLFETNPGYILDKLFSVFENLKTKQKKNMSSDTYFKSSV